MLIKEGNGHFLRKKAKLETHFEFKIRFLNFSTVECVFPMVVVPKLPRAGFGRNDHQNDAPHFTVKSRMIEPWFLARKY